MRCGTCRAAGFKGVTLTAGVKNLFDKEPPFSNQGTLFQKGYDPRYTDPVGRALYCAAASQQNARLH
jgi:iron complex outermembrane receptor protein